jgi:hypothetical protein
MGAEKLTKLEHVPEDITARLDSDDAVRAWKSFYSYLPKRSAALLLIMVCSRMRPDFFRSPT